MKLVVISSCSPANACLIDLVAQRHPVHHVFRVTWSRSGRNGPLWAKFARAPIGSTVGRVRRKFFEWMYERIELQAAWRLRDQGALPGISAPLTEIDALQINSPEFARVLSALEPDILLVSACPLLEPKVFEIPRIGTINVHRGIAPDYRGERTIFWPLYHREYDKIGVTLHEIDRGIDTGPVLGYGYPELSPGDSESSILAKCIGVAAELVGLSLEGALAERFQGKRQPASGKCYYRRDQRIWKELSFSIARSLGRRAIPARPRRIEMFIDQNQPALTSAT